MDYEKWTNKAKKIITSKISANETFELKELFCGAEWNQLLPAEKRSFGRYFSNEIREGRISGVVSVGENKAKHKVYKKIV